MPTFTHFWKDIIKYVNAFDDIADWWDELAKPEIKHFCIAYSIDRKRKRAQNKKFLLSSLKLALENKNWEEVANAKEQINKLLKEDSMGFVVRSRFGQNAEEERASLFHAGRELKNNKNNLFTLKKNGTQLTDESAIQAEVIRFFGALFATPSWRAFFGRPGPLGVGLKRRGLIPGGSCSFIVILGVGRSVSFLAC